jgi:hypothetical protein
VQYFVRFVFVNGPTWLGFYEGQNEHDICSSLTKVDAVHWSQMQTACTTLIDRKVKATLVGLGAIASIVFAWTSLQACANIAVAKVYSKFL